jgi:Protein of unknown function (DUF551)
MADDYRPLARRRRIQAAEAMAADDVMGVGRFEEKPSAAEQHEIDKRSWDHLAALESGLVWRDAAEEQPPENKVVLAWDGVRHGLAYRAGARWVRLKRVTHWCPLPDPPERKKES